MAKNFCSFASYTFSKVLSYESGLDDHLIYYIEDTLEEIPHL